MASPDYKVIARYLVSHQFEVMLQPLHSTYSYISNSWSKPDIKVFGHM